MQHEIEAHEADEPDDGSGDGQPIQVLLRHRGTGEVRLHTAAEEAGESATLALVQQDGQSHQEAGDNQDDLQSQDQRTTLKLL